MTKFYTIVALLAGACLSACNGTGTADSFTGGQAGSVVVAVQPSATPAQPLLVANLSALNYPSTMVGQSSSLTLTLVHAGGTPAGIDVSSFSASAALFSQTTDSCTGATLYVGQSCNMTVVFTPVAAAVISGVLTIPYGNSGGVMNQSVVLAYSATGTAAQPSISSAPSSSDFGQVTVAATPSRTFTISNTGPGSATFQAASITGSGYSILSDGCTGQTLTQGGATCNVSVQFSPSVPGSMLGQLTLNYQNSIAAPLTTAVALSGIGDVPQPELTLSPKPYNFGNVATNTYGSQTITVSNNTTVSATIGTASVSGSGYTITANNCNSTVLAAAANCSITVRFTPPGLGAVAGTLTLPFSSAQGISYTATDTLGGTGITPSTSFSFAGATGSTNLTATGVTLNWTAQTAAANSYYVVRWTTGGTTLNSAHLAPNTTASYNISGLTPNTTYQLKVNAYDAMDVSDGNNNEVTITTPNVTGATFNGWSDVVALGSVYTDIGTADTTAGNAGSSRWERNLGAVAGFGAAEVDTATNQITATNANFPTGTAVTFRTDGTAPTGLTHGNTYYVINVSSTVMKLASSSANAAAGTAITLSTAGSGNMTLMPNAVVKLGWDLLTFTPSGTASSYNVYRDTSAGFASPTLVGASNTNSFSDWSVSNQTTYYYRIKPVVGGTELNPAIVTDSTIQVYVPPQNMAYLHRWIVNREACTTLLGLTFSSGVNRNSNYSCLYNWGGTGAGTYGANATSYDKTKWDLGYSLVVDRWPNGCKMKSLGSAVPTGGSNGDVYLRTGAGTLVSNSSIATCYIKESGSWLLESGAISNAGRNAMRTNYPGYANTAVNQGQAYTICQQRSFPGVVDGNGNTALRLMRLHEAVLARAVQGINVNYRTPSALANIFNGSSLPTYGSCNTALNNNGVNAPLNGVGVPNPSTYSMSQNGLMSGSMLTKNCYSRYEISNLWDASGNEWLSSQYYGPSASGGYFVASALDPGDNLLEGYLMNGTVGPTQVYNTTTNNTFFGSMSTGPLLPLFGVRSVSVDATLGSKAANNSSIDYGTTPSALWVYPSQGGVNANSISMGSPLGNPNGATFAFGNRYNFFLQPPNTATYGTVPQTLRCAGQVGP